MSRNVRQKKQQPRAPPKVQRRRRCSDSSSSLDLSSDDGYSAVEDVPDSEDDDEEDVDAAEEEHIITGERHPNHSLVSPRPSQADDKNEDEEDDGDDEDDDEDDDEHKAGPQEEGHEETPSWNGILSDGDEEESASSQNAHVEDAFYYQQAPVVERHVRFAGVPDSDSDSTTSEVTDHGDFFPDLFVEQTSLDPAFRRELEQDPDDSSASGSFWDFENAYNSAYHSYPMASNPASDDDTPSTGAAIGQVPNPEEADAAFPELDGGYETDGDTTEEDVPEPPIRRKQVRRVEVVESSDSETEKPPVKHRPRGKPRVGRFHLDSSGTKPIAVVNPISRKMMIFTPQRLRRLDLSPESFDLDLFNSPSIPQSSPIFSNSATLMFGAMFAGGTFGDMMNTHPIGPAEAFFADLTPRDLGIDSDYSEFDVSGEDEGEKALRLEDFLTFDDDGSADEAEDEGVCGDGSEYVANTDAASTPGRRPSTALSASEALEAPAEVHPLLAHFDGNSNAVGAFRRNQITQQLINSDRATEESLLFSNKYTYGTLRGVRSDSLSNVVAPLTPARRQKRTGSVSFGPIDSSPLHNASMKRKASAAISSSSLHKRHRSISDVQGLRI